MDLHVSDTYAVIDARILPAISLCLAIVIWIISVSLNRYAGSHRLTLIHIISTAILLVLIAFFPVVYHGLFKAGFAGTPRRYFTYWTIERYRYPQYFGELLVLAFLAIAAAQSIFVLNLVLTSFRKKPDSNNIP